jgi:ABC-type transporter Mla MlaB component
MTRRSSPKDVGASADTHSESMKLTRAARRESHRIPLTVSTKSPKRKRVAATTAIDPIASDATSATTAAEGDLQSNDTVLLAALSQAPANDVSLDSTAVLEIATNHIDPIIALASNSTVKDAQALKTQLMKLLEVPETVAIDVRSVERVDTATMQLLCAFVRDRAERNGAVEWLGCPPAILDAVRLLGVRHMLALPAAAGAA